MGCSCTSGVAGDNGQAAIAAMCQTCPKAKRGRAGAAIACTLNGKAVESIVTMGHPCPLGRHPDADGRVRWLGADWLGVPEPIRWRLVWDLGREPRGLVGCGCLAAVKASWAGPWLEPWLEGVQALRTRLAGFMSDWRDAMAADAPLTPH